MDIGLPGRQEELVAAVAATGTPVVLVVVAGRPLAIESAAQRAAAVIHAWVPGEEGPEAIADVLFGAANPGGKLPITVPRHVGQIPIYYGHKPSGGRSNWKGPYVDGSNEPLWPFGFGLSYTHFEVRNLRLDRRTVAIDGVFEASVEVAQRRAIAPATRSSSSTFATWRRASRGRSRSCAGSSGSAWPQAKSEESASGWRSNSWLSRAQTAAWSRARQGDGNGRHIV